MQISTYIFIQISNLQNGVGNSSILYRSALVRTSPKDRQLARCHTGATDRDRVCKIKLLKSRVGIGSVGGNAIGI